MTDGGTASSGGIRAAFGEAPVRVLVVDDEDGVRNAILRILRKSDIVGVGAEDGLAALDILDRGDLFDVVLLDVRMPKMTGPQLLERMKAGNHPAEVVMMSAFAELALTLDAVRGGAFGFLTKPFAANEGVVLEVLKAAKHKRLSERVARLERELAERDAPPISRPPDTSTRPKLKI